MDIKEIEKLIRAGKISGSEIISEVERVENEIKKEKAEAKAKEVKYARNEVIAAFLDYVQILGMDINTPDEEDKFVKTIEDSLAEIEKIIEFSNKKKKSAVKTDKPNPKIAYKEVTRDELDKWIDSMIAKNSIWK